MRLSRRPAIYSLPPYSLTGDLLGFIRCGLQYRYTRVGQLPSSRPVQLWFGQFIHGVLEEAYRRFNEARKTGNDDLPPWPEARVSELCDLIKRRLAAQGLMPWSEDVEELGDARALHAINELGPVLFPLIHRAEVRLTGARLLPTNAIPREYYSREADRYEIVGVVDVITHVELADPEMQRNPLVQAILRELPDNPPDRFEIVIDYKGMRRPPREEDAGAGRSYWEIYAWQVHTYAHLRSAHEDSLPVIAGMIVYLNELHPTRGDITALRSEIRRGTTDVVPVQGSPAERILREWRRQDNTPPELPLDFRMSRALRVVQVTPGSIESSLAEFDAVVAKIETCRGREIVHGRIIRSWDTNAVDEDTCTACDARTFCPDYAEESEPRLPGVRPKV